MPIGAGRVTAQSGAESVRQPAEHHSKPMTRAAHAKLDVLQAMAEAMQPKQQTAQASNKQEMKTTQQPMSRAQGCSRLDQISAASLSIIHIIDSTAAREASNSMMGRPLVAYGSNNVQAVNLPTVEVARLQPSPVSG